jgi:hypothetical protein
MTTPETFEKIRKKYPSRLTRGRAIKLFCKENCSAGDNVSWRDCTQRGCFLWAFRMGKEILSSHNNNPPDKGKKHTSSPKNPIPADNSSIQTSKIGQELTSPPGQDSQTKLMEASK